MDTILQDVRHGIRILRRSPGFTILAVLTLALGVGGGTAVFSVVEARLFRPLPFDEPDELVFVRQRNIATGWDRLSISGPNFVDWRDQAASFDYLAAYREASRTLLNGGDPLSVRIAYSSADIFPMLAIEAERGRTWTADDASDRAVISYQFWESALSSREDVVGRSLVLDDKVYEVIGVLPADLHFPPASTRRAPDVWAPLDLGATEMADRGAGRLTVYGRMQEGVDLETARAELGAIAGRLAEAYPETNENMGVSMWPLSANWTDWAERESAVHLAAVGFVLLIGCVNIANLLLARLSSRRGEMAIRAALGAGRARLIRQLLTESFLVAAAGGTAGLVLAMWGTQVLAAAKPADLSMVGDIEVDARVLGFSVLATLVSALLFGALPALALPMRSASRVIRDASPTVVGRGARLRSALVVCEITLSLVGLVAAGLLIRGMANSLLESPGFESERLLTFRLTAPRGEGRAAFFSAVRDRIAAVPGVQSAAWSEWLPMSTGGDFKVFEIAGKEWPDPEQRVSADYRRVSPSYFEAMGVPLLRGRRFEETDGPAAPAAALVDRSFVEQHFGDQEPLGQRLLLHSGIEEPRQRIEKTVEIVGVVGGEKFWRLDAAPYPTIYVPYSQDPSRTAGFAVRLTSESDEVPDTIRSEIAALAPTQPIQDFEKMDERIERTLEYPTFVTILLSLFGLVGLALAAIGVFGVMSQSVAERSRELALRVAVGAGPSDLLRTVFGRGVRIIAIGLAVGVGASAAAGQLLQSVYYYRGVSPHDPWTFGIAATSLLLAALLACYFPARRAAKTDPNATLRGH